MLFQFSQAPFGEVKVPLDGDGVRVQFQRLFIIGDRASDVAQGQPGIATIVIALPHGWLEADGDGTLFQRFVKLLEQQMTDTQIVMTGFPVVAVQILFHFLADHGHAFFNPAIFDQVRAFRLREPHEEAIAGDDVEPQATGARANDRDRSALAADPAARTGPSPVP